MADIRDLMGDDQMVFATHRRLHIVANHAGAFAIRRHGPCVGIGLGNCAAPSAGFGHGAEDSSGWRRRGVGCRTAYRFALTYNPKPPFSSGVA
jgi:hypothetical protein